MQKKVKEFIYFSMNENLDIKNVLDFYAQAGVDATFAPSAGFLSEGITPPTPQAAQNSARPAVTALAQSAVSAGKSARDLCFSASSLNDLRQKLENFEGCTLKLSAKSTVFGEGNINAPIMFVGEAPGADEDRLGRPFVGRSGQLLEKMLAAVGLKRDDVYITNVLPWRPPGNRTPTDSEVAVCLPFLKRQIEFIRPKLIVLLGGSAANALLDNSDSISRLRGHWLNYKTSEGVEIEALATFHPAFLLRNPAQKAKAWTDFMRIVKKLNGN